VTVIGTGARTRAAGSVHVTVTVGGRRRGRAVPHRSK
jgi:hypothetical protein